MALVNVLFLLCAVFISVVTVSLADTFDVTKFGAVGDGKTDDSKAFLKAWDAACGAREISTLNVPSGKTFFLNPLMFKGPCNSPITVQIDGTLVAPSSQDAWKNCSSNTWIVIEGVKGFTLQGAGTLNAMGAAWWTLNDMEDIDDQYLSNGNECRKPTTILLASCESATLTGLSFLDSGRNHISINNCNNLKIDNINIKAPETSPNTDGIDIAWSSHVSITNSNIGTGDDCIALSNGNHYFNISGINCGPGHGISVGSLGKDGSMNDVSEIHVRHCSFTKTLSSARIKTWPQGGGTVKNIFYDHITLNEVRNAIEINQHYSALQGESKPSSLQISRIHFTNIHGSGERILLHCSDDKPCKKILVKHLNMTSSIPGKEVQITCKNAKVKSRDVTPKLPC